MLPNLIVKSVILIIQRKFIFISLIIRKSNSFKFTFRGYNGLYAACFYTLSDISPDACSYH